MRGKYNRPHPFNLMTGSHLYALYGSLRKGMSNRIHFAHAMEYVETVEIAGFRMHALQHYPYVVETGRPTDTIVAELTRITDERTEREMVEFEASVGYVLKQIHVGGLTVGIFVFSADGPEPPVPGGDWVRYFGKK